MSVMGNEFSGLPMDELIGGPLKAACDAQIRLAKATAEFINTVGFNPVLDEQNRPTGKLEPRQVDFSFWEPLPLASKDDVQARVDLTFAAADSTKNCKVNKISVKAKIDNKEKNLDILTDPVEFKPSVLTSALIDIATLIREFTEDIYQFDALPGKDALTIFAPKNTGKSANGWEIILETDNITITGAKKFRGGIDASGGNTEVQKVTLSVPFLSVVNIPALMIKKVEITFDMEVKSSESHKDESSTEGSIEASAKFGWGPISAEVKIKGSVSSHQENTRSTDRSAKYHVAVEARDDGMPEGLSRVLDILQKAIAPVSISKAVPLKEANIGQDQAVVG